MNVGTSGMNLLRQLTSASNIQNMTRFTRELWKHNRGHCWYRVSPGEASSLTRKEAKNSEDSPGLFGPVAMPKCIARHLERSGLGRSVVRARNKDWFLAAQGRWSLLSTRPSSYGLLTQTYTGDLFRYITYAGDSGGLCFADTQQLLPEVVQRAGLWKCKILYWRLSVYGHVILDFPNN